MDQDTARRLFEEGATLVVLDAPSGIEFGIDLETWETGPLFQGVKMIPPGMHYVHSSAIDRKHGGTAMRSGIFRSFAAREVVVQRWDAGTEQLVDAQEEAQGVGAHLRDIDNRLGAYPVGITRDGESPGTAYARWTRLAGHITAATTSRVLPAQGCFSAATGSAYEDEELDRARILAKRASLELDDQLPSVAGDTTDRFAFPLIDLRRSFPRNAEPAEIRKYSVDKTWLLRTMLRSQWNGEAGQLVGEFQLAFLVVLVGQNFTGLEHWKRLMHLVLGSASAFEDPVLVTTLFVPFLRALQNQLDACPDEFASVVLEQDNCVASLLATFVLNLYECPGDTRDLDRIVTELREFFADRHGWTLPHGWQLQEEADEETGEYAPQIIQ